MITFTQCFCNLSGKQATAPSTDNTVSYKELQVKSENLSKTKMHYWIASNKHYTRAVAFYASIYAEHLTEKILLILYIFILIAIINFFSIILDFSYCHKYEDVEVLYRKDRPNF